MFHIVGLRGLHAGGGCTALQDKFVRELNKTPKKKSGNAGPVTISSWTLFDVMSLLSDSVRHTKFILQLLIVLHFSDNNIYLLLKIILYGKTYLQCINCFYAALSQILLLHVLIIRMFAIVFVCYGN